MTNPKLFDLVKRWQELDRQQRDLDYRKSCWARDARKVFPDGESGDDQFSNWLATDLGMSSKMMKELLLRAEAVQVVPDEKTWKQVGGYRAIRPLGVLPSRQRVTVLEAAKSTGQTIAKVIRDRGLAPKIERESAPKITKPVPVYRTRDVNQDQIDHFTDACKMARWIAANGKNIPRDILTLINRYTTGMRHSSNGMVNA